MCTLKTTTKTIATLSTNIQNNKLNISTNVLSSQINQKIPTQNLILKSNEFIHLNSQTSNLIVSQSQPLTNLGNTLLSSTNKEESPCSIMKGFPLFLPNLVTNPSKGVLDEFIAVRFIKREENKYLVQGLSKGALVHIFIGFKDGQYFAALTHKPKDMNTSILVDSIDYMKEQKDQFVQFWKQVINISEKTIINDTTNIPNYKEEIEATKYINTPKIRTQILEHPIMHKLFTQTQGFPYTIQENNGVKKYYINPKIKEMCLNSILETSKD